jgi:hypothetical protein
LLSNNQITPQCDTVFAVSRKSDFLLLYIRQKLSREKRLVVLTVYLHNNYMIAQWDVLTSKLYTEYNKRKVKPV